MAQNHGLEDLPTEMFENIASSLDKKDLKSLRLVSRSCDSKIFETFTTANFRNLRVFLFPQDHKRTIFPKMKIVKHPPFGKAVRCVEISLSGNAYGLDKFQPQWQFLLGILFKDLKQHPGPHSICIRINGNLLDGEEYYPIVTNSLHTVFKAMKAADMPFDELDISRLFQCSYLFDALDHPRHLRFYVPRHHLTYDLLSTFTEVMHRTQHIKASFHEEAKYSQGYDGFVSALASLPALRTLDLSVKFKGDFPPQPVRRGRPPLPENFEDKELANTVMQKVFPTLERLAFTGVSIQTGEMLSFVNKQPKLTSLELYQVELLGVKDALGVEGAAEAEMAIPRATQLRKVSFNLR